MWQYRRKKWKKKHFRSINVCSVHLATLRNAWAIRALPDNQMWEQDCKQVYVKKNTDSFSHIIQTITLLKTTVNTCKTVWLEPRSSDKWISQHPFNFFRTAFTRSVGTMTYWKSSGLMVPAVPILNNNLFIEVNIISPSRKSGSSQMVESGVIWFPIKITSIQKKVWSNYS